MTIGKFLKRWANAGTKTAPSDPKQDLGWVDNEQVPFEWINWLFDKIEDKIDRIVQERVDSFFEGSTDPQLAISTGLWPDSWGVGNDVTNFIAGGSGKEYRDLEVYFTAENDPRLLAIDNAATVIEVWDPRSLTQVGTSNDLKLDLPSEGGEVWSVVSMCTDGVSAYVVFIDSNASPDVYRIQAWDLATWNVKTGWAATGSSLSGSGNGPQPLYYKHAKVIIADATYLAISQGWINITTAGAPAVQIVNRSTGFLTAGGAGDAPTGINMQAVEGICSDGQYIFFVVNDTTTSASHLCSAQIAAPTTGCGGANYPRALTTRGARLCAIGQSNRAFVSALYSLSGDLVELVKSHNYLDADLDEIIRGQTTIPGPAYVSGEVTHYDNACWGMVFDGINLWMLTNIDLPGGTGNQFALLKIDASKFSQIDRQDPEIRQLTDIATPFLITPHDRTINFGPHNDLVFDGRDLWVIVEPDSGQPESGNIYRLPLAMFRS